jgi:putative ABC transport system permease protein
MPPGFAVYPSVASMLWELMPTPARPDRFGIFVTGRLKPGVSLQAAETELLALHRQLHQHDQWGAVMEPRVYDLQSEYTWLTGHNLRLTLVVLFCAVSAVLLICCANVSNLLVGQSLVRRREMAIRAAIGSGRARLVRQLLTEHLLLSAGAALAGVALAIGGVYYFRAANPIELPPATVVRVDARILGFTVLLSVVTTVLFGLAPAWKASRTDLNTGLSAGGRSSSQDIGRRRFGSFLVVAEIALTMVLLAGAGLLIRSVGKFAAAPLGFQPEGLIATHIQLPPRTYAKPEDRLRFFDDLLRRLRGSREAEAEALSTVLPTNGTGPVAAFAVEGRPDPAANAPPDTGTQTVSPGYFRAMEIPLTRGRLFDDRDRPDTEPTAIVNEALVARYFHGENPLGRHIRPFEGPESRTHWRRIVGVVAGERRMPVTTEMNWADSPLMYVPWPQNAQASAVLILRMQGSRPLPLTSIQRAAGDPDVYVGDAESVPHALARVLAYPRFRAVLLAAFAGIALILAAVGLYGVLSRMVAERRQEIGVRMAVGARPRDVLTMFAKWGMVLSAIGFALGLVFTWILTGLLKALLYGVSESDPATLAGVAALLAASAGLATLLPAWRATRVDPMVALRDE